MAIDFKTIKKIDANGTNVGMIQDSAGNILWRKKYDELSIGTKHWVDEDVWEYGQMKLFSPQNVVTGSNVADRNYFWYNDRVDVFTPVNINAKLVVTWYENAPQLSNTSLLDAQAVTYATSTAVVFDYTVYCPGAEELGRIENQDSKFQGAATDSKACVMYGENQSWSFVMHGDVKQGDAVTVWNGYYDLYQIESAEPSSTQDYIKCFVEPLYAGSTKLGYNITFTLHLYRPDQQHSAVSFLIVDNGASGALHTPKLITLFPGEKNNKTIGVTSLNIDILKSNSYVTSSSAYLGGGKFTTITTLDPKYFTLAYSEASVKRFNLNPSGEIVNDNQGVASSCSYCTIYFKRPAAQYTRLRIHYTQDSENHFDYGIFSNINKWLCPYPVEDSTTTSGNRKIFTGYGSEVVQHSCKDEEWDKVITYDISSLDLNTLYGINVKYIKDSSDDTGTDTFKITKIEFVEDVEYDFHYDATSSYYTLTVSNHGSTDVSFEWLYVYIGGSSQDYTQPDEGGGDIPAGGSYDFRLHMDPIPEQSGRIFCIFKCNGQYHTIYQ